MTNVGKRSQVDKAADDEPRVEFSLNGGAAAALCIDDHGVWPNLETVSSRRRGRAGWSYVVRLPVMDAERMLDDLIGRGSNGSGEGYDQEPATKYACRRAAEALAEALKQAPLQWERPFRW